MSDDLPTRDLIQLPEMAAEQAAPEDLKRALAERERPCGTGRVRFVWNKGPKKGHPLELYCAEPLCLDTGYCTGPRFIAPEQQWTAEQGMPDREARRPSLEEAVAGAAVAGNITALQTGRRDEREPREIADHIKRVWLKMREHFSGQGGWSH